MDDRYLEDGKLRASFLATMKAKSEGISTPSIAAMLVAATTEPAREAVYEKLMEMLDDMYMVDTVAVSILTALYHTTPFDTYDLSRYLQKKAVGPIDCMASCFVRTCFLAMRYHHRNIGLQDVMHPVLDRILSLNTITPCDFVYECLARTISTHLTHRWNATGALQTLLRISSQELAAPASVSATLRARIVNLMFLVIENSRYKGPQSEVDYSAANMNAACDVLCMFVVDADYDAHTMATAYACFNRALTEKNPAAGRHSQWNLLRYRYLPCFVSMLRNMASGHAPGTSPMVVAFLNSGLLANMHQDSLHDDGLGEDVAIEASLYTLLLDAGYRSLLEMTEIVHKVSTFLTVGACTAASMPVEDTLLTMLTRCVTLVDVDPIARVDARWQHTLCKLGLISLCISKTWKYMLEYVAETHKDNVRETAADARECNVLKWLDLLEVLLYKNPKNQRNFIRQRGMQVLFRAAVSSYSSVEQQIMVLLCTMLRDNSKAVLSQCPDFLNREVRPEIDRLDVVTFTSRVQQLSEASE